MWEASEKKKQEINLALEEYKKNIICLDSEDEIPTLEEIRDFYQKIAGRYEQLHELYADYYELYVSDYQEAYDAESVYEELDKNAEELLQDTFCFMESAVYDYFDDNENISVSKALAGIASMLNATDSEDPFRISDFVALDFEEYYATDWFERDAVDVYDDYIDIQELRLKYK